MLKINKCLFHVSQLMYINSLEHILTSVKFNQEIYVELGHKFYYFNKCPVEERVFQLIYRRVAFNIFKTEKSHTQV